MGHGTPHGARWHAAARAALYSSPSCWRAGTQAATAGPGRLPCAAAPQTKHTLLSSPSLAPPPSGTRPARRSLTQSRAPTTGVRQGGRLQRAWARACAARALQKERQGARERHYHRGSAAGLCPVLHASMPVPRTHICNAFPTCACPWGRRARWQPTLHPLPLPHPAACAGAGAAVIAFSTTDRASFEAVPGWHQRVVGECGGVAVALVQTKCDMLNRWVLWGPVLMRGWCGSARILSGRAVVLRESALPCEPPHAQSAKGSCSASCAAKALLWPSRGRGHVQTAGARVCPWPRRRAEVSSEEAEAMARRLGVRFYRCCTKEGLNVEEGAPRPVATVYAGASRAVPPASPALAALACAPTWRLAPPCGRRDARCAPPVPALAAAQCLCTWQSSTRLRRRPATSQPARRRSR